MPDEEMIIPANAREIVEFGNFRNPDDVIKTAQLVATTFKRHADKLELYKQIGASKHLLIEGWQTLAAMYRVTAGTVEDRFVQFGERVGFEATAEAIYVPTGRRISTAFAMCLDDEDNWGFRPKYEWLAPEGGGDKVKTKTADIPVPLQQLRSMAQTRACSKVLSNLLKWVARMAGYAGTPAEEMTGHEGEGHSNGNGAQRQAPQRKPGATGSLISEAQGKRMFGLAHSAGKSRDAVGVILAHFGFPDGPETVTRDKYEAICAAIMRQD